MLDEYVYKHAVDSGYECPALGAAPSRLNCSGCVSEECAFSENYDIHKDPSLKRAQANFYRIIRPMRRIPITTPDGYATEEDIHYVLDEIDELSEQLSKLTGRA
jgi:hypothetical protein